MIKYTCGNCGSRVETEGAAGTQEDCPACHQLNTIPQPAPSMFAHFKGRRAAAKKEARAATKAQEAQIIARNEAYWKAKAETSAAAEAEVARARGQEQVGRYSGPPPSYARLSVLAQVFSGVGWVLLVVAGLSLLAVLVQASRPGPGGEWGALLVPLALALAGAFYLGLGELLVCFRDTAINTFHIVVRLSPLLEAQGKGPDVTAGV